MAKEKQRSATKIPSIDRARILATVEDLVATDPLSPVSRGERKVLLIVALTTMAVTKGGLVPREIPALGIIVEPQERLTLLYILTGILIFYLIGFWLYGRADLKRRRAVLAAKAAEVGEVAAEIKAVASTPQPTDPDEQKRWWSVIGEASEAFGLVTDINRFARLRIVFDAHAPLLIAVIALALVLHETWRYPGGRAIGISLLGFSFVAAVVVMWRRRKRLVHKVLVGRHKYYFWRMRRISKKIQAIPSESPERARLQDKVRPIIDKAIKGPWV